MWRATNYAKDAVYFTKVKNDTWEKIEVASILVVYPKRFLRFLVNLYMEAYVFLA